MHEGDFGYRVWKFYSPKIFDGTHKEKNMTSLGSVLFGIAALGAFCYLAWRFVIRKKG